MAELEARWDITDVAEYLDISKNTLYSWHARNYGPPGRKVGKHLRFDPTEVKDWYFQQPTGAVV